MKIEDFEKKLTSSMKIKKVEKKFEEKTSRKYAH